MNLKWFYRLLLLDYRNSKVQHNSRDKKKKKAEQEAKKKNDTTTLKDLIQACVQALSDNRQGERVTIRRVHLRTGSGGILTKVGRKNMSMAKNVVVFF